jgi:hypothetical protein
MPHPRSPRGARLTGTPHSATFAGHPCQRLKGFSCKQVKTQSLCCNKTSLAFPCASFINLSEGRRAVPFCLPSKRKEFGHEAPRLSVLHRTALRVPHRLRLRLSRASHRRLRRCLPLWGLCQQRIHRYRLLRHSLRRPRTPPALGTAAPSLPPSRALLQAASAAASARPCLPPRPAAASPRPGTAPWPFSSASRTSHAPRSPAWASPACHAPRAAPFP